MHYISLIHRNYEETTLEVLILSIEGFKCFRRRLEGDAAGKCHREEGIRSPAVNAVRVRFQTRTIDMN